MALVFYGGHITNMRGSVGGSTHSRNISGDFMRSRRKPLNPVTLVSINQRINFTLAVQSWKELDPANQAQWSLMSPKGVSGFNFYVAYYLNALKSLNTPPLTPPLPGIVVPLDFPFLTIDLGAGTAILQWNTAGTADNPIFLAASSVTSKGTTYNKKYMRAAGPWDINGLTSIDIWNALIPITGGNAPQPGGKIHLSIESYHNTQLNFIPAIIIAAYT